MRDPRGHATSPRTATQLRRLLCRQRPLSREQLDVLIDDLNAAVADYRDRRRQQVQASDEPARLFAETVAADVRRLLTAIERRQRAIGRLDATRRTRVISVAPNTMFSLGTGLWRVTLRKWGAQAQAEVEALRRPPGRPRDEARLMCDCAVAAALARAGVTPTKAKTGAFAQVLRHIVYPAIDLTDRDVEHAVRAAVDALPEWRGLPAWRRRLQRAGKPARKISS